jgi:hypothetical protein
MHSEPVTANVSALCEWFLWPTLGLVSIVKKRLRPSSLPSPPTYAAHAGGIFVMIV